VRAADPPAGGSADGRGAPLLHSKRREEHRAARRAVEASEAAARALPPVQRRPVWEAAGSTAPTFYNFYTGFRHQTGAGLGGAGAMAQTEPTAEERAARGGAQSDSHVGSEPAPDA